MTEKIGLVKAEDICQIIKVCAKSEIRFFRFGDLQLEFGAVDQSKQIPVMVETKPDDREAVKISEEAERKLSLDQLRADAEELKLSDPLAYEQFIEGEFGDAGGSGEA